jgi:hypothetical protein
MRRVVLLAVFSALSAISALATPGGSQVAKSNVLNPLYGKGLGVLAPGTTVTYQPLGPIAQQVGFEPQLQIESPSQQQYYEEPAPVQYQQFADEGPGEAAAPPRPPYDVNQDPSYLAFIAALDQQGTQAGAQRLARLSDADTQRTVYQPRIAEAGVEQRRRIGGSYETRGMFRSGARLRDVALQQRGEAQQQSDLERGVARSKTDAQLAYDQALADIARERATKALELTTAHASV